MSDTCENCGQPVLNTDAICWHCGWRLVETERGKTDEGKAPDAALSTSFPLSTIAAYAGLTILIFFAALWTMSSLGQQPQELMGANLSLTPGWRVVVSRGQTFALQLPPDWTWFEINGDDAALDLSSCGPVADLVSDLLVPFRDSRQRLDWLAAAGAEAGNRQPDTPCLLIAGDTGPTRISSEAVIDILQQRDSGFMFLRAILSTAASGGSSSTLLFDAVAGEPSYRCQAKVIVDQDNSFFVAACAPQSQFSAQAHMLETILESFQPLPD